MQIYKLRCVNYRNISDAEIIPHSERNIICGENAQGKTNLLEAIWLFSGAKSFRNSKESQLVKFGCEKGYCETEFQFSGVKNTAKMEFGEKRTAFLNGKPLINPSKLAGNFNAIVFSPNDLSLVKDGPAGRRRFLDIAIGQLYPNYIEILRSYTRAVAQRNSVIKDYRYDGSLAVMLDVFEREIADSGQKILVYRKKYLEIINKFLPEIYNGLSGGKEAINIEYISSAKDGINEKMLYERRKEDMYSGVTSAGPHRDDIEFFINGISARSYGSQGQKRSVALALKLAQAEVIKEISGEYPVCLLDDVMSELDPIRQNYILNHIKGWQSFITCCDPSNYENLIEGKVITVKNGGIF